MPRHLSRGVLLALAFAASAGLVAGCKKDAPPEPEKSGQPAPGPEPKRRFATTDPNEHSPTQNATTDPGKEDPEVQAYLQKKGWKLYRDMRISDGKRLTYLSVENKDKPFEKVAISPEDYKAIARSKTLQVLDLRNVDCTDDGLKAVAGIPQTEGIIVNGERVTDAGVKALSESKSLDNVTLLGTKKVTDAGVNHLAALPRLQALYLAFLTLDGSAFEAFAGSKTLTSLTLDYIDGFTDAGARNVAKIPNLSELKITSGFGERKLTSAGIRAIVDAHLPPKFDFDKKLIDDALLASLVAKGWLYGPTPPGAKEKKPATPAEVRSVSLDGSSVTDKGFEAVLNCTNVRSLFLAKTGITDETLKKLGGFKNLEYLSLEQTKVGAPGLEAVAGLPIKHIAMQRCDLTEDAFKAFGKMKGLEELWLNDAKMQAAWLKHLAGLPKLRDLNLQNADFDDAAVKYVLAMPELQSLAVHNTKLTDAGFAELLKHPKLKSLYVDGTKVTKEVYQKAKKDHPKLFLYYYRYDN